MRNSIRYNESNSNFCSKTVQLNLIRLVVRHICFKVYFKGTLLYQIHVSQLYIYLTFSTFVFRLQIASNCELSMHYLVSSRPQILFYFIKYVLITVSGHVFTDYSINIPLSEKEKDIE